MESKRLWCVSYGLHFAVIEIAGDDPDADNNRLVPPCELHSVAIRFLRCGAPPVSTMEAAKIAALESTVATLQANVSSLVSGLTAAVADTTELKGSVDTFYLLYSGALVFFMQARVTRAARQPTGPQGGRALRYNFTPTPNPQSPS